MHLLAQKLQDYHVILGSASPRRKELLMGLDIPLEIRQKNTEEIIDPQLPLELVPQSIAEQKFSAFIPDLQEHDFLITADTLVFCEGKAVGKPKSLQEAKEMIQFLSGKTHTVVTGVCVGTKQAHKSFYDTTKVTFTKIAFDDIEYYIDNYHPLDKAGAYGVQEWIGYVGIEKLEGSYYNVMGFPVQKFYDVVLHMK